MATNIHDLQKVIESKERLLASFRSNISQRRWASSIEKIQIEHQIIEINSDLLLLRKQFSRKFVIQQVKEVQEVNTNSDNVFYMVEEIADKSIKNNKKNKVKEELENGNIVEAIEYLKELLSREDDKNNVIMMKAQFSLINKKFIEGFVSFDQLKTETNRIMMFILSSLPNE